jgi:flagellar protein FlbB
MRIQKLDESVNLRIAQLQQDYEELGNQQADFDQKLAELQEREEAQQDREKSFNDRLKAYDNRRANLIRISEDLTSMRPEDAVAILVGYDDQLLIDTLRVTQELADQAGELSLVSVWLSRMPPERAADIQRKMAIKPQN